MPGYLGTLPPADTIQDTQNDIYEFTAMNGQTNFTGSDNNAKVLDYAAGLLMVALNGVWLDSADYSATDGINITLSVGAIDGQSLKVMTFDSYDVINSYTKAQVDAKIAAGVGSSTTVVYEYTADASQTIFTGIDDNGSVLSYTPTFILVIMNGVILDSSEYTATDSTNIVLSSGLNVGDVLNVLSFGSFDVANTYTKAESDNAFTTKLNFESTGIDDNATSTAITIDTSENTIFSGKIGIGATTPEVQIHIKGESAGIGTTYRTESRLVIEDNVNVGIQLTTATSATAGIYFGDKLNNGIGRIEYSNVDDGLTIIAANTTFSGNVGIGLSPSTLANLHIKDDIDDTRIQLTALDDTKNCLIDFGDSTADAQGRIQYNHPNDYMRFDINAIETLRLDSSQNAIFSGNVIMAAGKGIDFGAVSGNINSKTLDDYEEGSWTPIFADSTTGGNTTTSGSGSYTKIGSLVTVMLVADAVSTAGLTGTNDLVIRGLPFPAVGWAQGSTYTYRMGGGAAQGSSVTITNGVSYLRLNLYSGTSSDIDNWIIVSDLISGTTSVYFTITYRTA